MNSRQEMILGAVIEEYIDSAIPVSSSVLVEKYFNDLSSATLRTEMMVLEKEGYLYQPYTSAGRLPTDQGFRFFVDKLMGARELDIQEQRTLQVEVLKLRTQNKMLARSTAKLISALSNNLTISGMINSEDFYKSGVQKLVSQPEFNNLDSVCKLAEILDYLDEHALTLCNNLKNNSEVQVYIGKESPIGLADECSIIVTKYDMRDGDEGLLAIIGPKRMEYSKNLSIIDYFKKILSSGLVVVLIIL